MAMYAHSHTSNISKTQILDSLHHQVEEANVNARRTDQQEEEVRAQEAKEAEEARLRQEARLKEEAKLREQERLVREKARNNIVSTASTAINVDLNDNHPVTTSTNTFTPHCFLSFGTTTDITSPSTGGFFIVSTICVVVASTDTQT
ncbi:hypothetical protein MPER_08389 [Moniliophthora perniciosa FA553]|nr:hypothetical protein MPER_08389 [Moniliophthora perniciosa FA553]